jgi:23S rRNA pseudouridine2605 synthase
VGVRLQKVLAGAGVASRRGAEGLIEAGRVKVDGKVVTALGTRVAEGAVVEVDGRVVQTQDIVVVVLNKPDLVSSRTEGSVDERGRPTVASLLRGMPRLVPIGRLDFHARGVLLLTNDGTLAEALSHPRREVAKTYHAKLQGRLGEAELEQLHAGVVLEDGTRTKPALEVEIVKATTTNTWVQITIGQGLYRQVRRMGDALGHPVLKLIRVAYGGITAIGLRDGEWRLLRADEVDHLRKVAAGKPTVAPEPTPRVRSTKPGIPARPAVSDRPSAARGARARPSRTAAAARPRPAAASPAKTPAKAPARPSAGASKRGSAGGSARGPARGSARGSAGAKRTRRR